jgi:hypothetical protein
MPAESPELSALRATAANLEASIAARTAVTGASPDHIAVTNSEKSRLVEVKARIAELSSAPAPK